MSENLPASGSNLCRGLTNKGEPCKGSREPDSDFCYRHQPRETPARNLPEPDPFPPLPSREALATPEGVRTFVYDVLEYISQNKGAELKRVYALRQFTDPLLRSVDMAALGEELVAARGEVERLSLLEGELRRGLEREREQGRRRASGLEEEIRRLRAANEALREGENCPRNTLKDAKGEEGEEPVGPRNTRNGAEKAESSEGEAWAAGGVAPLGGSDDRVGLQEELEGVLEEQHARREAAEIKLRAVLDRLRRIHRALCFGCAERVRPVIGGEPQPGDSDFRGERDRREYVGRSW